MDTLGIQPMLAERVATIQPRGEKSLIKINFLKEDEYKEVNVFKAQVTDEDKKLFDRRMHWLSLSDEDRDDGPMQFRKLLQLSLNNVVKEGRITREQAEKARKDLFQFANVFSRYAGAYTGEKVTFKLKPDASKHPRKGEKFKPNKKLLPAIRKHIKLLLKLRIIGVSRSPYINTMAPVVKKNGEIRLCLAGFDANQVIEGQKTEPPPLELIIFDQADYEFYCSLDFVTGFWQLILDPESRKFTVFQFDGQVYEFCGLPYGIKTESAEFIHMINHVIPDEDGISKFVDDLLVAAKTLEETIEKLARIFTLLREKGLKLNPMKTQLFKQKTDHLGFVIGKDTIGKQDKKL